MYLLWPENGDRVGRPVAVNRTEAWWLGGDKPLAGETVSVYGRNLSHGNGTSAAWIYLKPKDQVSGRWVAPTSVNPYRVSFVVPALAAGDYEVWAHNGHGGNFGWSGPLALSVLARSPWAGQGDHVFDVKAFGAVGDGVADDSAAIQNALKAAGKAAPATVYFPAGTFLVNGTLDIQNNVSWLGNSRDTSIIKVGPTFATAAPSWWQAFINSDSDAIDHVEFKNLTFDGNGNLGKKSLIIFRHHDYVQLTNSRFKWKGTTNGFNIGSNRYLSVTGNEFIGDHVFLGDSKQVEVRDNSFHLTDYANAALISWGGNEVAISNNRAQDFDPKAATMEGVGAGRFFVAQSHPDSNRNLYIGDNTTLNMAPPRGIGDANQGEQILFEVGTSTLAEIPVAVTTTTVTFSQPVPQVSSSEAVVIKGRGAGQFRHVSAINGNTITVSSPWSVVPDNSSVIGVGPAQTRSVVYHNHFDGKGLYAYETASVAMNMYGNVSDVVFANNTVTRMVGGISAEFSQVPDAKTPAPSALYFNLITGNSLDGANVGLSIATNFLSQDVPGTLGHLGNTYRGNTLSNIVSQGIHLTGDENGRLGGDLNLNTFEHNTFSNVPVAVWLGKPRVYLNNPVNTIWSNLNFYRNTFNRGTAAFAGSKAFVVAPSNTSLRTSANVWQGFETSASNSAMTTSVVPAPRLPVGR